MYSRRIPRSWPCGLPARRTTRSLIASILLACGVLLSPGYGRAGTIQQFAGPTVQGDDTFQGAVGPYNAATGAIPLTSITYAAPYSYLNGQCVWINTALNNYIAANQFNATQGQQLWTYNWVSLATEKTYQAGMTVTNYYPFVGSAAAVTVYPGYSYPAIAAGEYGGAVFSLTYTAGQGGASCNQSIVDTGVRGNNLW